MRNRRRFAALLLSFAASAAVAVAAAQPANAVENYRLIQNYGSGLCLQTPPGNETSVGWQLVQQPCNPAVVAQRWALNNLGGSTYQLINLASGGCMDAHGAYVDRTPVDTWPCSTISNQRWTITGTFQFKAAANNKCLDVAAGSLAPGAPIQIYGCTSEPLRNNPAQAFFIRLPDGT